jgi:hypothetical protein
VADEILLSYLSRHGKGREIFDSPGEGRDPAGDVDDDRREGGGEISPDDLDDAA